MFSKLISGAACTCLAMASFNASAALIDITATSTDVRFTDFTLRFDDISDSLYGQPAMPLLLSS